MQVGDIVLVFGKEPGKVFSVVDFTSTLGYKTIQVKLDSGEHIQVLERHINEQ